MKFHRTTTRPSPYRIPGSGIGDREVAMNNRISNLLEDTPESRNQRKEEAQRIDEILSDLLAHYERRFPGVKISVVETPVAVT